MRCIQVGGHSWHAYPRFAPPERFAPFKLAAGVYYNNAWENAASAMEMSAISAYNSALLVQRYLADREQSELQPLWEGAGAGADERRIGDQKPS